MLSSPHPLALFLREIERHHELDHSDQEAVLNLPIRVRRVDAASYLVREGHLPEHCSVLMDGFAYRQKLTGEGSRQILAISIPGDAVDLQNLFLNVADHSVQMLTDGTVADLRKADLQEIVLNRPPIGSAIIQMTLAEASVLREWVVNVGRRAARERIAHLFCEFAVRLEARGMGGTDGFELPMTQEQLADTTGLTPVHVNRVLKSLEVEGLISRKRRHIHFPDWRALQRAGDFSRQYLHLPAEDILHDGYQIAATP